MRYLLLTMMLLFVNEFVATGCYASGSATRDKLLVNASPAKQYHLCYGLRATVKGHAVVITDGAGVMVARNSHLIRQEDERKYCPSEGFERIVSKGDYFTIEQQTCGGWLYTTEYITFRYVKASGKIVLHKYGRVSTDRRDPSRVIPAEVYTAKQLGQRAFAQVTKAVLDAVGY